MMYYLLTDLGNKTAAELAQDFATIPEDTTTIDLSENDL